MAVETTRRWDAESHWRLGLGLRLRILRRLKKFFGQYRFNSITRRIIVLNFFGVAVLVSGILYLNEGRVKFTETRVQSLTSQAEIIASAIAQISANQADQSEDAAQGTDYYRSPPHALSNQDLSTLSFRINPEIVAPILRDLIGPTKTRAYIYDAEGALLLDSKQLYARGQIGQLDGLETPKPDADFLSRIWTYINSQLVAPDLPLYRDLGPDGKAYDDVRLALNGSKVPLKRLTETGETVISVSMPIQRQKAVLGALILVTQGADIDEIIAAERWQVVQVAGLVIFVTAILSWLLAGTIAGPMHRLAAAAERVRRNIKNREQIPDFSNRPDEIGYLSRTLRDMTNALYTRLDAIESFAADVSHELKNPLTSLRSAAGMLPLIKNESDKQKLIDIIQHDVRRLDRLITDIADASRLDAELARETAKPVNVANLLNTLCDITRESRAGSGFNIVLRVQGCASVREIERSKDYEVCGHDSRLSQVITNLLENAISFSPKGGSIFVSAKRFKKKNEIEISVEDEGPGISPENFEKIFKRFYTDRPEPETFGQNSGLGLNISEQIVKAHGGRIWAENRLSSEPTAFKPSKGAKRVEAPKRNAAALSHNCAFGSFEPFACGTAQRFSYGARFVIRLPATGCPSS